MNNKTLAFYNKNAKAFAEETAFVDFKETQDKFINILQGKRVLDFGCGAGRDSKYFVKAGLDVVAIDGSAELCQIAESYVGIPVQQMLFKNWMIEADTMEYGHVRPFCICQKKN